jgi:hypothetical protein
MRFAPALLVAGLMVSSAAGCGYLNLLPGRTIHQRCGWKAEDYFADPKVIALCKAIEANDLAEMERRVKAGADVNAQGKGKMTPLLWAFADNKLPSFKWLLEHGANPNVVVESDFGTKGQILVGDSVTHMVCLTSLPGYFDAVFDHGGDPNLPFSLKWGLGLADQNYPPLKAVTSEKLGLKPDEKLKRIKRLIALGADMNVLTPNATPVMYAVLWPGQFELALAMLEGGADFRRYMDDEAKRLIHVVAMQERRLVEYSPEKRAQFQALVKWLKDHGESYEEAKADLERWASWGPPSGEYDRKMAAEIAERKAREKAAAEKKSE